MSKGTLVLIDADMFVHRSAVAVERATDWDGEVWTLTADLDDAKDKFRSLVADAEDIVEDPSAELVMVFSPSGPVFRHSFWPTYKEGRGRKPLVHRALKEWVSQNYADAMWPGLEADDVLGILATHPKNAKRRVVIVSGDKDLAQIPTTIYDFNRQTWTEVSEEEADMAHLLQTLTGDPVDKYPGCPGIGAKRAPAIAAAGWPAIVAAFEKAGLTEDEALIQARLARILRFTDYDHANKEPILWQPH
ncbi:hypothetical protein [Xanthobacter sp. YC-JY1]|uniref:hypothetical protein n=1 Tax=Xanthobacter sp. YC-JY1 TaxID=2419844 RepID=UPI001F3B183C|nr:hypothetical protein [Xanthobacter sp. YC-JY1]UJX45768.1 exonuclease [Xanthobacter sp. YC-JY1]